MSIDRSDLCYLYFKASSKLLACYLLLACYHSSYQRDQDYFQEENRFQKYKKAECSGDTIEPSTYSKRKCRNACRKHPEYKGYQYTRIKGVTECVTTQEFLRQERILGLKAVVDVSR